MARSLHTQHGINTADERKEEGRLTIIVIPDIEFTELHRDAIGIDFEKLKGSTLPLENIETVNLFNSEDALPNDEINVTQSLVADATTIANPQFTEPQTHSPQPAQTQEARGKNGEIQNEATAKQRKNKENKNKVTDTFVKSKRKRKKMVNKDPPKTKTSSRP